MPALFLAMTTSSRVANFSSQPFFVSSRPFALYWPAYAPTRASSKKTSTIGATGSGRVNGWWFDDRSIDPPLNPNLPRNCSTHVPFCPQRLSVLVTDATLVLGVVAWCKGAAAVRDAAGSHAERLASISQGMCVAVRAGYSVLLLRLRWEREGGKMDGGVHGAP